MEMNIPIPKVVLDINSFDGKHKYIILIDIYDTQDIMYFFSPLYSQDIRMHTYSMHIGPI
jgi:hypothetical protein